jgi:prepilin-type N-terminal cleavage/methylation domain-containing protein
MTRGMTVIEIVVAIALAAIIFAAGVAALNPAGQLASARNSQRSAHVQALVNAIRANITDYRTGVFTCGVGDIPSSSKKMATGAGNYDIAPCLVPSYITVLPFDPSASGAHYASNADYDTGYFVMKSTSTGQVTVSAPSAELGKTISIIR